MTKIVKVSSILDINFEALRAEGISHVMSDIESTLCPYGVSEVDPAVREHIDQARELGHISTFDLVTNKTDPVFLEAIKGQFSDVEIYSPRTRGERKPSPVMLERSMRERALMGTNLAVGSVMIGDKYTGDMRAARRAFIPYGFWVRRLGRSDHPGDRLVRRPYERLLRPFVK